MRKPWAREHFVIFGRCPSLNSLILYFIIVTALITVLSSPYPASWNSIGQSPVPYIYRNYRRLREQTTSDLLEIQALSFGINPLGELQYCGKERDNNVPCYNVSANLLAGLHDGDEIDRHCEVDDVDTSCLVHPPKDYRIPLWWPAGKDIIWSGNVKITKDQFLSPGSMNKRMMLLEDNQIAFYSDDGLTFDGVKDYSGQIAEMIGLGSDSEFLQVGHEEC